MRVAFVCSPAGWLSYPLLLFVFSFFVYLLSFCFSPKSDWGGINFIPFVQLSKRLCKRIEKRLNSQSCKAKLLLHMIEHVLVVIMGEKRSYERRFIFSKKATRVLFNHCFVQLSWLQPFYQLTRARFGLFFFFFFF